LRIPRFSQHLQLYAVVASLCGCAARAAGQHVESSLDLGGVAIRYADSLNAVAATSTANWVADWGSRVVAADGTYSRFGSDWSLQGQASGSLFLPWRRFVGELAGSGGGSTHRDGSRTGEVLANVRLHAEQRFAEWFVGIGAGQTTFAGDTRTLLLAEAGLSRSSGAGNVTLTFTPVAMGDSIRYADAQASLSWQQNNLDLSAVAGSRVGDQLESLGGTSRVWGNLSVTRWLTSRAALVLAGGSYPIDPTQGFPGGRFVSLSVRLSHPPRARRAAITDSAQVVAVPPASFEFTRSGEVVTFRVYDPVAHNVELAGDFTEWDPVAMTPTGNGWWISSRGLNPGKYQINLRIDGGKWIVPPGLLGMLDEFGGSVGLLVVD